VSVIVVSWNVRDLVLACLDAVFRRSDGLELDVIVVDNASEDGTVEAVAARFPEVRVVSSPVNLGFPRANNVGLERARGRHVLFLNPDTEVGEGTLRRCVRELDGSSEVGLVGCRLVEPDGTVQREGGRRHYRLRHLLWESFYLHVLLPRHPVFAHQLMGDWDHRDVRDVEAVMGAFMMVRAEVARDVGGLPHEVFMYHEDLAFCLRVRRAGWRIRYLGDVETLHLSGASSSRSGSPLRLLEGEVRVRLIRERAGPVAGAVARALFAFRSGTRLLVSLAGRLVPGLRERPRWRGILDTRTHALHLLWAVAPGALASRLPRAEELPGDVPLPERRGGSP
jgi:hypothetical protein